MIRKLTHTCALMLVICSPAFAAGSKATTADISAIKVAMEDRLKDADSANIKDVRIAKDGTTCGQVNAKNSYGAYGGFEPFIAMKLEPNSFYVLGVGGEAGTLCESKGI
jgi:K+-transporting ATPase A subunit